MAETPAGAAGGLWQRIKEHKLVQTALAYFAAALALAHGEELIASAYEWPHLVGQVLIGLLALGLPVTLAVVWYSGRERSPASRAAAGRTLDRILIAVLALLVVAFAAERFLIREGAEPTEMSQIFNIALGLLVVVLLADRFLFSRHAKEAAAVPMATSAPAIATAASPAATLAPADKRVSLAVLPFLDMSPGKDQEYFSDGLSEELLNQLARVKDLRVAARTSSFAFKGQTADLRLVGEKLGVGHVLEGSVRKAGNRLRITAQLINASDGYHLWSDTFDRELDDVFAIQENVAREVAKALGITLGVGATARVPGGTTNLEAYDKYLRAQALTRQLGPAEITRAAQIYREALALDPDFARAWYELHSALATTLIWVPENAAAALKEMSEASAHIVALAPDAWWTQAMRASQFSLQHKWSEAEAAGGAALASAPASEVDASRAYAFFLWNVGRGKEAVEYFVRARRADPLSLAVSGYLQIALGVAGDFDEAQAEYERSKDLAGDRAIWEWFALLRLWWRQGADPAAVRAQFDRYLSYESLTMALNRVVADKLNDKAAARAAIRQAFEDPANQDPTRINVIGFYADHFDDKDLALAAMRRSLVELNGTSFIQLWHPNETGLRADPRFKALVRELGLYDYWRKTGNWGDHARPVGKDDFEIIR